MCIRYRLNYLFETLYPCLLFLAAHYPEYDNSFVPRWLLFKETPGSLVFSKGFLKLRRKLARPVFKRINPCPLGIATRIRFDSSWSHASCFCQTLDMFHVN